MYSPSFDELVGSESTFFEQHFNSKPFVRRGALTERIQDILSISDLDAMLSDEAIRVPYLRIAKQGAQVPQDTYTRLMRVQGEHFADAIVPSKVVSHFQAGATITWNSLNHFRPNMRELTRMLSDKFDARSDVIAFLTPAGREGFKPHYDPVELFIIQLHGTKYWRVWDLPQRRPGNMAHFHLDQLGEPLFSVSLEPGDVMYMPYNTPHVAAAEDSMSLHLSVMVRPRRWSEILPHVAQTLTARSPEFWTYPAPQSLSTEQFRTTLLGELDRLGDSIRAASEIDIARLRRADDADVGSDDQAALSQMAKIDAITSTTSVFAHPTNTVSVERDQPDESGKLTVLVAGSRYRIPAPLALNLAGLPAGEGVEASRILDGTGSENMEPVRTLARIGAISVGG